MQAGIELAAAGYCSPGIDTMAGVAPNAAYRHFSSHRDLLQAVRAAALSSLANAIEAEIARAQRRKSSPAESPRATLRGWHGLSQVRHLQRRVFSERRS